MVLQSLRNHRGFFSDYWLGTILGSRGGSEARLTAAQARKALERISRLVEGFNGIATPDLTRFRERFARPLLHDFLGFELHENQADPRLRPLSVGNGGETAGPCVALALLCPDPAELDARHGRRQLEDALISADLDHGFLLSPEVLRLVRRPGLGARGAAFDVALATLAELQDGESLVAAYRVLAAQNFVETHGARPIDVLEEESRRHSAKVSSDLKSAVFEAAERIVGGFLADVRERAEAFADAPTLADLRDAGFLALYRLLFILYAEARDERLIHHRFYQRSYSLDAMVSRLLKAPAETLAANRNTLWFHLQAVFRIFNEGIAPKLPDLENIPPRGGRLFSEETPEGRLLRRVRLNDRDTAAIILSLGTTRPRRGVGRERVSFRELEIEQLGAVYEGLLEYEPGEAIETLIECAVGGRQLVLNPEELIRLTELKGLVVRGDATIVAGTEASYLHPDSRMDDEDIDVESNEDSDSNGEAESEDESSESPIKRGAALVLLRRLEPGKFFFKPGVARKASGSYYTPTAMVNYLVRESLRPLAAGRTAAEIEQLRVIDLACGSGHFLVGAARYLGGQLFDAYKSEGAGAPPSGFYPDRALSTDVRARWESEGEAWCKRRIVEKCLFGVDLNPAAVQLAQVALWIESLAGDRPLSFFAHHIRNGNSLLGSSLATYDRPPDPKLAPRADGQTRGIFEAELKKRLENALAERQLIDAPLPREVQADTPAEYAYKEDRLRRAETATAQARLLLDLRSASAFLPVIWRELPSLTSAFDLVADTAGRPWWEDFQAIRDRERFFHWELEFPEVFLDRDRSGFDVVLGNPPWDKVVPNKQEFYGRVDALIGAYTGNDLDTRIRELNARVPGLAEQFANYRERATTIARMLRGGGDFALAEARSQAAHEEVAKYFVDRALALAAKGGAAAMVVPSVFYNGDGWVGIRRYLLEEASIERFYGFENRRKIFPIDSRYKFVNLVVRKDALAAGEFTASFMRHEVAELESNDAEPWQVRITSDEIKQLSPETLVFLEYRSSRDQEIVRKMHAGRPTLVSDGQGSWGAKLFSDFAHLQIYNATRDQDLFTDPTTRRLFTPASVLGTAPADTQEAIERMRERGFWPVFEGKHVDQFLIGIKPLRWWMSLELARKKYDRAPRSDPTLVFRNIASNTNERTCIAAVLPAMSAGANTLVAVMLRHVEPESAAVVLNSLCFDYALRLRTSGSHVSFTFMQPMPVPVASTVNHLPKVGTQIAWDGGVDHISEEPSLWPALWEANRAVAEAYDLSATDFKHILSTFPGLARKRPNFHAFLQERLADWASKAP